MRYLDPRADLTFKKVFGEHPDLVKSLLNALLPFETPEEEIDEIEYLPAELVPDTPLKKNSIVDVRCRDMRGRRFIVEMQMLWSPAFMQRVLFNASKACVRQLGGSVRYELLQPVYSLNLLNGVFVPDLPDYYHDYRIVRMEHTEKVIEGLRFIFVELPKFTPSTFSHKKMHVLWLRYLTEINESTRGIRLQRRPASRLRQLLGCREGGEHPRERRDAQRACGGHRTRNEARNRTRDEARNPANGTQHEGQRNPGRHHIAMHRACS